MATEVAQKLNDFFSDSVKFLGIPINSYLTNVTDHLKLIHWTLQ